MQEESTRHRWSKRFNRILHRSRDFSVGSRAQPIREQQAGSYHTIHPAPSSQAATDTVNSMPINPVDDIRVAVTADDLKDQSRSGLQLTITGQPSPQDTFVNTLDAPDLWTAAFREAVDSSKDIDVAILKGKNTEHLLRLLLEADQKTNEESAFKRGLGRLHAVQGSLEGFKLALDLASPLTALEPTVATVFGVVRSVTTIAISLASADADFAKQIGEMLAKISYIDDCDTLGQKANNDNIHNALVLVYQKMLEFYQVALDILAKRGAKLLIEMILSKDRLPGIVQEFLTRADALQQHITNATLEITQDIHQILYRNQISQWLECDEKLNYHWDMREASANEACEFLLTDINFIEWYRAPESRQLVIVGDRGSGKTFATAFLVDELDRRREFEMPRPKICFHYCRSGRTGQATYVLSVLIQQLLEGFRALEKKFYDWFTHHQGPRHNKRKVLEEFLQMALESLDRPLYIIVDGLDECDRVSRDNLLKFFMTVSQKKSRPKIILSCRPEDEILEQLGSIARIDLVSDGKRDGIIVEHTVRRRLSYLSTDVKALIVEKLSLLAQGSAIWTSMMIELIVELDIRERDGMRSFLDEMHLPEELSELYNALFSQCTSNKPKNQEITGIALKLLAVSCRPLSMLELAWATSLAATQQEVTNVAALAKLRKDPQWLLRRVRPFIARIDSKDENKRQIRLAHHSVKEFIIKDLHSPSIQTTTDQTHTYQRTESLESWASSICIRYLLLDDIGRIDLFSEDQMAIDALPQEIDLFVDYMEPLQYDPYCSWEDWEEDMVRYDPRERGFGEFFVYASSHWLEHFGAAKTEPFPNLAGLEILCQAGSTRLQNWAQQNCRPDCTIKPRMEFPWELYDPLSITMLYGSEEMICHMLENSDFEKVEFFPQSAVKAADQVLQWGNLGPWGDLARLGLLMESKIGHQLRNLEFFKLIIRRWSHLAVHRDGWDPVFDIIDHVMDTMVQEHWANELLCVAARTGCMPIIQRLMTRAQHGGDLRTELLRGVRREQDVLPSRKSVHQSIGEAVLGNHFDVVEYLLGQEGVEAHLQYLNSHGENVLHLASALCNPEMFRLLVPRFQEGSHQPDDQGNVPLVRIITSPSDSQDRYESARILLLQGGTSENHHLRIGQQDPLRIAVQLGDLDMCSLLIDAGKANPLVALSHDLDGHMILRDETADNMKNKSAILQLLCQNVNGSVK